MSLSNGNEMLILRELPVNGWKGFKEESESLCLALSLDMRAYGKRGKAIYVIALEYFNIVCWSQS